MNKKLYKSPLTQPHATSPQRIIAYSGGGKASGDPIVDPEPDASDDESRVKEFWEFQWED